MSSGYTIQLQITDLNIVSFRQDHAFYHLPLQSQICTINSVKILQMLLCRQLAINKKPIAFKNTVHKELIHICFLVCMYVHIH